MDYKELVKRLREACWTNEGLTDDQSIEWDASTAITELLERVERAEKQLAESERHGHWIYQPYPYIWFGPYNSPEFVCSVCRGWNHDMSEFCPDCGAKMDEREE